MEFKVIADNPYGYKVGVQMTTHKIEKVQDFIDAGWLEKLAPKGPPCPCEDKAVTDCCDECAEEALEASKTDSVEEVMEEPKEETKPRKRKAKKDVKDVEDEGEDTLDDSQLN